MMSNDNTTPVQRVEPNLFQLKGEKIQINYQSTGFVGAAQLTYTDDQGSRTFSGDEVRSQESEIGLMVSVTLQLNPDSQIVILSLLVPSIKLGEQPAKIKTLAIKTTKRSGFLALQPGALQSYSTIPLEGTASLVDFLAPASS